LTTRKCKNWLKAFLRYASFGEAPLKMYWWTGVSTIAGALRRRVWIDQVYFQWVPNFYIILVAPPGIVSKSTTANVGMNLLRAVPGITFGPDVVTWQKLVEDMGKSKELVLNPETGEYLPMCCVTIASGEFGTFLNPENKEMVDTLVALWDGQPGAFAKSTKSSGSDVVENPWINIIGCTTPAWIAGNFPEYMIGGGFTSRAIFVYADQKRQYVAYPSDHVPAEFQALRADLVHDLEAISQMVGEYIITDDAKAWGETWYQNHWRTGHHNLSLEQFGGYLARKQTHIHKLAMVIAASESSHLSIEKHHLELASEMIDTLEDDMPKVFDKIGRTTQTQNIDELCNLLARYPSLDQQSMYRKMSRKCTWDEFNKICESAVAAGYMIRKQQGSQVQLCRGNLPHAATA
jgi:hypothetical protein